MNELLREDKIMESAVRRIEAKKAALIAEEMDIEIRKSVKSALRSRKKELTELARESVEEELKTESFRSDFKKAIAAEIRTQFRDGNIQELIPSLFTKIGEAMISAILK